MGNDDRRDDTMTAAPTASPAEGGRVLADALVAQGVDTVFLIPGTHLDHAVEGLRQRADSLRLVVPRHEQSTTYMADGYYRASGRPGVALVVPGPGVLNAGAGLATAYASNSKLVFIAAQIHSASIGAGHGNLHEIPGQSATHRGRRWTRCASLPTGARGSARAFISASTRCVRQPALFWCAQTEARSSWALRTQSLSRCDACSSRRPKPMRSGKPIPWNSGFDLRDSTSAFGHYSAPKAWRDFSSKSPIGSSEPA
jgi:hypothetical protein